MCECDGACACMHLLPNLSTAALCLLLCLFIEPWKRNILKERAFSFLASDCPSWFIHTSEYMEIHRLLTLLVSLFRRQLLVTLVKLKKRILEFHSVYSSPSFIALFSHTPRFKLSIKNVGTFWAQKWKQDSKAKMSIWDMRKKSSEGWKLTVY